MTRATKRTVELIEKIVEGLQDGRYENELCDSLGLEARSLRRWKNKDEELRILVHGARLDGIMARLEADKLVLEKAVGRDDILRAKECLAHSRWEAEKLLKDFQPIQKQEVAHVGPMVFGWEGESPKAEDTRVVSDEFLNAVTPDDVAN